MTNKFRTRLWKTHALGEMTGSGLCRTLCTNGMATGPTALKWSVNPTEVDCAACRKKM